LVLSHLVQGFVRVPFDDIDAIEAAIAANPNIVAILVEPIQGEGGIRIPKAGFCLFRSLTCRL
jgi:acetylornithine/N-succinyldiaminopimelate aminotransferase